MANIESKLQAGYLLDKAYKKLCDEAESFLEYEGKETVLKRFFEDRSQRSPVDTMTALLKQSVTNHYKLEEELVKEHYSSACCRCPWGNGEGGCTVPSCENRSDI